VSLSLLVTTIGGGAGGHSPPNDGVGGTMHSAPPTLTPVDRNKAYCFHELVLNLPLRWTSNDQNAFSFRWGASPPLPPDQGLCPQTPVIGSCSALAMVPPQPLTPSAAYGHNSQPWALQTVEPIEVLFGVWTRVGPRNPYVGPDPQGKRHLGDLSRPIVIVLGKYGVQSVNILNLIR